LPELRSIPAWTVGSPDVRPGRVRMLEIIFPFSVRIGGANCGMPKYYAEPDVKPSGLRKKKCRTRRDMVRRHA